MTRRWNQSAEHPRFLVSQSGRLKCKQCGKESPKRTFEDLMHFSWCEQGAGE
jgi:hypothetical protein